jgi:hypothetical protein
MILPQPSQVSRGRHHQYRPTIRWSGDASMDSDRRVLVPTQRHTDRRILAIQHGAGRGLGARPRRSTLSRTRLTALPFWWSILSKSPYLMRAKAWGRGQRGADHYQASVGLRSHATPGKSSGRGPATAGDMFLHSLSQGPHIPLPPPYNQRTCGSATRDTYGVAGVSQIETG